ncbi:DinB family protein [Marinactinospora thermotolerans]|uniref:DinB family protein n=1 Tax=Marinactinospora thermotolerans TaxID=531310 RepID=UPI003D8D0AA6
MASPPRDPLAHLGDSERRVFHVATNSERETLEAFLDFYRGAIIRKVVGVSEADARRRPLPSATSLAGLLAHLCLVERNWFQRVLPNRTAEEAGIDLDGADTVWEVPESTTVAELVAEYEQTCAQSRAISVGYALDDIGTHELLGPASLRWILIHMIGETARHAGHADILREKIDGATGI